LFFDVEYFSGELDVLGEIELISEGSEIGLDFFLAGELSGIPGERTIFWVVFWARFELFERHNLSGYVCPQIFIDASSSAALVVPSAPEGTFTLEDSDGVTLFY